MSQEEMENRKEKIEELVNNFYELLQKYRAQVEEFTEAVDKHIKALEKNPELESLDQLIQDEEQKLKKFDDLLDSELRRINDKTSELVQKCQAQIDLIEKKKGEFSKLVTNMTDLVGGPQLHEDIQVDASIKDDYSDISATAMASLEKAVASWISATRLCEDLLYTRLEKHEALLGSKEKLVTNFAELLKMREELVHIRLEKHESFLRSKQEVLKSFEDLINSYIRIEKEVKTDES